MIHVSESDLPELVQGILAGKRTAISRAIRCVDDFPVLARNLALQLAPHIRGTPVIGITGNPGAGKSTVVDALIAHYRSQQKRVGVLAVDPSSPFSGGAILGDRIRMNRHYQDDGVFIRSLATRGSLGGLSRATFNAVRVLDAAQFDVILVETVGVGQDEVDIARLSHTTIVVMVPGMGDDIQAIKAGLLEIADIFLINKADRPGVSQLERALKQMLSLVSEMPDYDVPIVQAVATVGQGIPELAEAVAAHATFLTTPAGQKRIQQQRVELFDRILDDALIAWGRQTLQQTIEQERLAIQTQHEDMYAATSRLLAQLKQSSFFEK